MSAPGPATAAPHHDGPGSGVARTARLISIAALLLYAASGGGRIVGSDEVTMFQVARAMLHGRFDVPEGATLQGKDGRFYSKNMAGQAALALPLVAVADGAARLAPAPVRERAARALVSFFNAIVTALLLGVFYAAARSLGAGTFAAMTGALLLGFSTPFWVYSKSFMAEPLEALGLLLALSGAANARSAASRAGSGAAHARSGAAHASRIAALGVILAVSAKLSMLPLALACLVPLARAPRATWRWPAAALILALAAHAAYDVARFGTPFETGYGTQVSPSAYTTPLFVGLYGLLFSSGKGVFWFAPMLWLAPAGFAALRARTAADGRAPSRAAVGTGALLASLAALLLYAPFQHWAGEGSFGPRYLLPLLPLIFLAIVFALEGTSRARRALVLFLAAGGFLVALGGVGIYFGAAMHEAGDYPYTLPLDDPHFMESSHFNPRFSPIARHWSMLSRNVALHLHGQAPRLSGPASNDTRLGLNADEERDLLHALDFWWAYAAYAGLPALPLALAALALVAAGTITLRAAWRSAGAEAG